jgi:dTDP-glucose pyrophosphorylase
MTWQNLLLRANDTIHRAIEVIDQGAKGIALVVEDDGRLIGSVTDGDIRRGILRHVPLTNPVSEVMNPHPKTLGVGYQRAEAMRRFGGDRILQMPVVDPYGVVVGLETLGELIRRPSHENPVFIMAGGFGTRLKPLTENCPKPMLPVAGKPMLEHILEDLVGFGLQSFYISVFYLAEQIIDYFGDGSRWGVRIDYVREDKPLGTAGALGLLPRSLPTLPLIMINGDILTRVNYGELLRYHTEQGAAGTVCVREHDVQVPYGVIEASDTDILNIIEKPVYKFFVNAGIYVLSPEVVRSVEPGVRVDMPDLLKGMMTRGRRVGMFPVHEYWLDIGRMPDFQTAQDQSRVR